MPRAQADEDVDAAISHYLKEGGEQAALGFIDAFESGYAHMGRHPVSMGN